MPAAHLPRRQATAVVVHEQKVLVILRHKDGRDYAVLPGGGIEAGESPESACLRELSEETGLKGTVRDRIEVPNQDGSAVYLHVTATGTPRLGGPETERSTPMNRYEPMWIAHCDLGTVGLVPESAGRAVAMIMGDR